MPQTIPHVIPQAELERLQAALLCDRDRLAVRILLATGLRTHELVALDIGDLLYPDGSVREAVHLRVYKGSRAGTRRRPDPATQVVYLPAALRAELHALIAGRPPDEPLLFTTNGAGTIHGRARRLSRFHLSRIVHDACIAAGIPPYHAHDLRHTYATRLIDRGVGLREVQVLCRHGQVATTLLYTHPSPSRLAAAVEDL